MLSTIVKLLTWVKHEIYKKFHSFYILKKRLSRLSVSRVSKASRVSTFSTFSTAYTSHLYSRTRVTPVLCKTHTDLCLTLVFSSKTSVLRAYTSFIIHDNLIKRVILVTYISCCNIMIMPCSHYVWYSVKCWVSHDSKKCDKCVCCDVCCNADSSKLFNWSQLNHEQEKICSALAEAKSVKNKTHFWICCLKKQKELLDCCEGEMIWCDLKLLKELKCVEAKETATLAIAQSFTDSSTDVFNFSESELTSAKWSSFWLESVSSDNTFQ